MKFRVMAVDLKYVARGIGGVDEIMIHLDDTKVLFGILRFVFGKGTFARIKYVAVHFVGSKCPVVKQGRANAQKNAALEALGLAACSLSFDTPDQCSVDAVLAILHRVVVVDDPALGADGETPTFQKLTVATMREDVEAQLAAAKALQTAKEAEAAASRAAAPRIMVRVPRGNMTLRDLGKTLTLKEALPYVRSDVGQLNSILVTADPSWPEVVNGGAGSVPELLRSSRTTRCTFVFFVWPSGRDTTDGVSGCLCTGPGRTPRRSSQESSTAPNAHAKGVRRHQPRPLRRREGGSICGNHRGEGSKVRRDGW